jgi:hypothetical protein
MFPKFSMRIQSTARIASALLVINSWFAQQAWAQTASTPQAPAGSQQTSAPPAAASQTPDSAPSQTQPAKVPAGGTTVNPSQAPLQPVTTYPDATGVDQQAQPGATPPQAGATTPNAPQPKDQPGEPQGAATAEKVPTAGGAVAKPAGVAIAPAKQHRTRSLLIKIGAVAAAGVAAGTVYALSRGTSSTPPGANSPGAVQK